jgi:hypothetical protein
LHHTSWINGNWRFLRVYERRLWRVEQKMKDEGHMKELAAMRVEEMVPYLV